jgi:hypothetical protein
MDKIAACVSNERELTMWISAHAFLRTTLPALLALFLSAVVANSQIGGGSIIGAVRDPSGAAVPGVRVVAHNQDTNEERTVITNSEGYYEFPLLPAARYQVTAEAAGFKRVEGEVFTLYTGYTTPH